MSQRIVFVDSFTNRAFAGNPAAVCLLGSPASDRWMQHVAAEMNLSETAFVHPDLEQGVYRLRWLRPALRSIFAATPRWRRPMSCGRKSFWVQRTRRIPDA